MTLSWVSVTSKVVPALRRRSIVTPITATFTPVSSEKESHVVLWSTSAKRLPSQLCWSIESRLPTRLA